MPRPSPSSPLPPPPPNQSKQVLESITPTEFIAGVEKNLLKFLSLVLVLHGLFLVYGELVQIFYVFPHTPEIFQAFNFSPELYKTLVRRSILLASTAILETIYGLALIRRHHDLAHHTHIISAAGLLIASLIISSIAGPTDLDDVDFINPPPTIVNLLRQPTLRDALDLFKRF